jgi:ABC-type multidrug transport system fused ATPase/permease subunit
MVVTDLTARYPDQESPALNGVSFTAWPGTVTAIVGQSGVGKSTLLAVLEGFLQPTSGRVEIGETNIREFDSASWRRNLAVVQQDPALVGPMVADDVRRARPEASTAEVEEALRIVGLNECELRWGAMTRVGDLGTDVSAGQRRRIALARVVLEPKPIILLDEPTAGLDAEAEAVAIELIRGFANAGAVVIAVAHRPALIAAADQIVELEHRSVAL